MFQFCSKISPTDPRSKSLRTLLLFAVIIAASFPALNCQVKDVRTAQTAAPSPDDRFIQSVENMLGTNWYGIYFQGKKIGYAINTLKREISPSGPVYRSELTGTMTVYTRGAFHQIEMVMRWYFDSSPPYDLAEFINRMKTGSDNSEIKIIRDPHGYQAWILQGGEMRRVDLESFVLTLDDMLAVATWIQQRPRIGDRIRFEDLNFETLQIDQAFAELLKIESAMVNGIEMTYYTVLQKPSTGPEMILVYGADGTQFTMSLGGVFKFQLEPETIAKKTDKPVDLFLHNFVRIDTALGNPQKVVRLKAALDDKSGLIIREAPGQTVEFDAVNVRYIITTVPGRDPRIKPTVAEIDKNLAATTGIPIDHPKVVGLARQAISGANTTAEKVARLVRFVADYIKDEYNANRLTVLDILANREGTCSEHALLFTALARALAIPCREVFGLVYAGDKSKGFLPHAWNEVVVDGYWLPVDPTWGQTTIDATHIRFSIDQNEMFQLIGAVPNMKIEVLKFETDKQ